MLKFNPEDHTYTWCGFPVPSLSEVLQQGGVGTDYSQIPEAVLAFARERGSAVHRAIEAFLKGEALEFSSEEAEEAFDLTCGPYVEAFHNALPLLPELDGCASEVSVGGWCGFGTTPDIVTDEAIIEVKCTSRIYPTHWIQLAGQAYALRDDESAYTQGGGAKTVARSQRERIILQLKADGKPTIKRDKNTELHDDVFRAAKLISEWKGKRP